MNFVNSAIEVFKDHFKVEQLALIVGLIWLFVTSAAYASGTEIQLREEVQKKLTKQLVVREEIAKNQRPISMDLDNVSLVSALHRLAKKVRVGLSFEEHAIPDKKVTLSLNSVSVFEALDILLRGTNLEFVLPSSRDVLVIRQKLSQNSKIQVETIRGIVTDAQSGETLPGVNISVKGTTSGTFTDENGHYELEVSSLQDTLIFTFIGYQKKEVSINRRTNIDIALDQQAISGEELVVVGYGEQQQKDLTGSVGSVSIQDVNNQPISGGDGLITGQISGVHVTQPAGIPGGGPKIQIRGVGAIGAGDQPLYVIDGFPIPGSSSIISNPLNDIPPGDIASISVLKDASATAIYGSRGANGVVLIETKKGRSGVSNIQINAYSAIQKIPQEGRPDLLNAQEFATFMKQSIEDANKYLGQDNMVPEIYQNPSSLGAGTNWFNEITRVAPMQNIRFSISGGNNNVRSFISGGILRQKGVVIGTDYNRFSFRANVDASLSDKFKVELNLAPTFSNRNLSSIGGAGRYEQGFGYALVASPIPSVYNDDGTYSEMIQTPGTFSYPNPLLTVNDIKDRSQTLHGIMSGFMQYNPINVLTLKSSLNLDYSNTQTKTFHPSNVGNLNQSPPVIPSGSYNNPSFINWDFENTVKYQDDFRGGHNIKALVGFTVQKNNVTSANFTATDYPNDDIETLNAAATIRGGTTVGEWSLVSYLARLNYSYKDKYLLTATVRRDGSSRFGSNNQWGLFPSGALGWRISDEPFMDGLDWINELKLKTSYGVTGNFNIGNYTHISHVGGSDYVFGGGRAPGKILTSLGNPDLGWERSREVNIGLDLGLWNNRVSLSADLYKRNTQDLLLNVEIPQSSGFSSVIENRGDVENRGLELDIKSRNLGSRSKINWTTNFNISFNRNKVLKLGRNNAPIKAGTGGGGVASNITMVGKPVGLFYGWQVIGLYQNQEEIDNSSSYPTAVPGDLNFKDINGDGKLTEPQDFTIIGNPYPDFIWGLTNSLEFKNFNLRVLVTGSYGGERYREDHHYYHNIDGVFNVSRDVINRWRSPEQPGNGKVPSTVGEFSRRYFRHINSLAIEDNSYIWVKNITLGYDFPNKLVRKYMQNVHVYLSIQNAVLFTGYGGSNPESTNYNRQSGAGALAPGLDFVNYPTPRIITMGLQFNI